MPEMDTLLDLSTLCNGELNEEFINLYPRMLGALNEGEKATVSITIEVSRPKNISTMARLGIN